MKLQKKDEMNDREAGVTSRKKFQTNIHTCLLDPPIENEKGSSFRDVCFDDETGSEALTIDSLPIKRIAAKGREKFKLRDPFEAKKARRRAPAEIATKAASTENLL